MTIEVSSNKYHLKLTLKSKITRLIGNSATGKSTLRRLVAQAKSPIVQIKLSDKSYQIANLTERDLRIKNGLEYGIWIVDENMTDLLKKPEYLLAIQNAENCYFIIMSRNNIGNLEI